MTQKKISVFVFLFLMISFTIKAQFLKRLKDKATQKIEQKVEDKIDKQTDKVLDDALDDKSFKTTPVQMPDVIVFTKKIEIEMSDNLSEPAKFTYLIGDNPDLYGVSINSDNEEENAEVIMVVMKDKSVVFMNVGGLKMKSATAAQQYSNTYKMDNKLPKEDNYQLTKTGRTKTILTYLCDEYQVTYTENTQKSIISLWVTGSKILDNKELLLFGIQNNYAIQGSILEINSKQDNQNWTMRITDIKSTTTKINTKEYSEMGY
ncbi:hypothetical protein [Polaribacter sp.]|uniref:hypothetical protein n=1 Tax=Polaribacter sp. TaxID=1920175 RepID=UPI0040483C6A